MGMSQRDQGPHDDGCCSLSKVFGFYSKMGATGDIEQE